MRRTTTTAILFIKPSVALLNSTTCLYKAGADTKPAPIQWLRKIICMYNACMN